MPERSIANFLEDLQQSQLLNATPPWLPPLSGASPKNGGDDVATPGDAAQLAARLVREGHLTSWQAHMLLAGHSAFFLGKYRLLERLGAGGMGEVFKARQTGLERIVALKVMSPRLMADAEAVARFRREIRATAALNHPNLVRAYDADTAGRTHFLVMEYVPGESLDRVASRTGQLPSIDACNYIRQAALGLHYVHERGMVHRDIKPANLLLETPERPGDRPIVKILDLGLARFQQDLIDSGHLTMSGQIVGTPDYMSPEQADGRYAVDARSDIYSLGCTLFRLLTGRVPFDAANVVQRLTMRVLHDAPSVTSLRPDLPPELSGVVAKMLARSPADRYQSAGDVARALARFSEAGQTTMRQLRTSSSTIAAVPEPNASVTSAPSGTLAAFLTDLSRQAVIEPETPVVVRTPPLARHVDATKRQGRAWAKPQVRWAGGAISVALLALIAWFAANRRGDAERNSLSPASATNPPIEDPQAPARRAELRRLAQAVDQFLGSGGDGLKSGDLVEAGRLRTEILTFARSCLGSDESVTAAELQLRLPTALDRLARRELPQSLLAWFRSAGVEAPPQLLAVLGEGRLAHFDKVRHLFLADQGATIVAHSADQRLMFWDAATGDLRRVFEFPGTLARLAPSPNGRIVAVAAGGDGIAIYNLETGQAEHHVGTQTGGNPVLSFSPDGRLLATGGVNRQVYLFETDQWQEVGTLTAHEGEVTCLQFSPDGRWLASGDNKSGMVLWDVATRAVLSRAQCNCGQVRAIAFRRDGKSLAVGGYTGLQVFDLPIDDASLPISLSHNKAYVNALAYLADGDLVSGGNDGTVMRWDLTAQQPRTTMRGHVYGVATLAVSPAGSTVISGGDDHTVRIWDSQTGEEVIVPRGHRGPATALAVSETGDLLATGGFDRTERVWDLASLSEKAMFHDHAHPINGLAFHAPSRRLASASYAAFVRSLATGQIEARINHSYPAEAVALSHDGRKLAIGYVSDKSVALHDLTSGNRLAEFSGPQGHTNDLASVEFSPDDNWLASGGQDHGLRLWDLSNYTRAGSWDLGGKVSQVLFNPRGDRLFAIAKNVQLYSTALKGSDPKSARQPMMGLPALSPDCRQMAVLTSWGTLKLYDASNMMERGQIKFPPKLEQSVVRMAFCSEGRHLILALRNGTVWIVRLPHAASELSRADFQSSLRND